MRKFILLLFAIIGCHLSSSASNPLQLYTLNDANFSVFKGSTDGNPTKSYEAGQLSFQVYALDDLPGSKSFRLNIDFFSNTHKLVFLDIFSSSLAKYQYDGNPDMEEAGFAIKEAICLNQEKNNKMLLLYTIGDKKDLSAEPYAIRIQIFEHRKLVVSVATEYTADKWRNLRAIFNRFK